MKQIALFAIVNIAMVCTIFAQEQTGKTSLSISGGVSRPLGGYDSYMFQDGKQIGSSSFHSFPSLLLKVAANRQLNRHISFEVNVQFDQRTSFDGRTFIGSTSSNDRLGCTYSTIIEGELPDLGNSSNDLGIYPDFSFTSNGGRARDNRDVNETLNSPQFDQLFVHLSEDDRTCDDNSDLTIFESGSIQAWNVKVGPRLHLENDKWSFTLSPQFGLATIISQSHIDGGYGYEIRPLLDNPIIQTTPEWTSETTHGFEAHSQFFTSEVSEDLHVVSLIALDQQLGVKIGRFVLGYNFAIQTSSQFTLSHAIAVSEYFDVPTNAVKKEELMVEINRSRRWNTQNHSLFILVPLF